MTDTNYYAENGFSITQVQSLTGINISDGWVEVVSVTTPEGQNYLVTDISVNADQNGTFRIKVNGDVLKPIYYTARDYIDISRNLPFLIPSGVSISIEWKTDVDGSNTTACIAGYLK